MRQSGSLRLTAQTPLAPALAPDRHSAINVAAENLRQATLSFRGWFGGRRRLGERNRNRKGGRRSGMGDRRCGLWRVQPRVHRRNRGPNLWRPAATRTAGSRKRATHRNAILRLVFGARRSSTATLEDGFGDRLWNFGLDKAAQNATDRLRRFGHDGRWNWLRRRGWRFRLRQRLVLDIGGFFPLAAADFHHERPFSSFHCQPELRIEPELNRAIARQ